MGMRDCDWSQIPHIQLYVLPYIQYRPIWAAIGPLNFMYFIYFIFTGPNISVLDFPVRSPTIIT